MRGIKKVTIKLMNKIKLMIFGGSVAAIAAISIFAAQASTGTLTATCSGSVSGNQITWMATSTGGNAPYSFVWTGDSSVAGATSTSFTKVYTTNGTYNAGVQVTDASSTMATTTCSAMVTSNVPPATTSTLNVIVSVNNTAGGSAIASNFTIGVSGASATPGSFAGSSTGTAVVVTGGTAYSVSASSLANYVMSKSGNCAGPITAGAADACTITEAFVPPSTTTSTLPRVNQPTLVIGPNGSFLARGMTVTSIASGSFQGQIWGITYTINWSGNLFPEFFFRDGHGGKATSSPAMQVAVGDEVGVAGTVSATNPLVVNATVVRDYSITSARPGLRRGQSDSPFYNGVGNGGGNGKGEGEGDNNGSTSVNVSGHLNDLLNQLHNLQNLFKNKGDH